MLGLILTIAVAGLVAALFCAMTYGLESAALTGIAMEPSRDPLALGEFFEVHVRGRAARDIELSRPRLVLRCTEEVRRGRGDRPEVIARVVREEVAPLAVPAALSIGEALVGRARFQIPREAPASLDLPHYAIRWSVDLEAETPRLGTIGGRLPLRVRFDVAPE